ncbi:hypothetical protein CDIK_2080 [Cucumispora dikerogammari]|nr:hypothetical protein CDIK_2080 [Cucumispora dikerogammari]
MLSHNATPKDNETHNFTLNPQKVSIEELISDFENIDSTEVNAVIYYNSNIYLENKTNLCIDKKACLIPNTKNYQQLHDKKACLIPNTKNYQQLQDNKPNINHNTTYNPYTINENTINLTTKNQTLFINCICEHKDFNSPKIKCTKCPNLYHCICLGFFSPFDLRVNQFICIYCQPKLKIITTLIYLRKIVYFIYQNITTTTTEIYKNCQITKNIFNRVIKTLIKLDLHDVLFEIKRKKNNIYKSKTDYEAKRVLLRIFNGCMDLSDLINIKK